MRKEGAGLSKKVTLKDIAEATGVTTASVSMILNRKNLSRFTPELVARVKNEVLDMGILPYYGTAVSHINSQRVAQKAGVLVLMLAGVTVLMLASV